MLQGNQIEIYNEIKLFLSISSNPTGYVLPKSGWAANRRIPYLYYINDNKTILIILQGDITRTKVDAIVNGLCLFEMYK